jgi:thiol-disulfide isomerase/thioredoxin
MKKIHLLILLLLLGCDQGKNADRIRYSPFSNSVIKINYLTNTSDTLYVVARASTNIPRDGSESNDLVLIEAGTYFLNIEIDRPVSSQLAINNDRYNTLIEPNDTTQIELKKGDDLKLTFTGKNKDVNEYYLKKKESLGYTDIRSPFNRKLTSKSTYRSVKQSTDSIANVEFAFLQNYKKTNTLPSWFIDYEFAEITYSGAGWKTFIPGYIRMVGTFSDSLPQDYFSYLEKTQVNNQSAIFSSKYLWFLDEYFRRTFPEEYYKLSGFARSQQIHSYSLAQSKSELSGQAKEVYHKYQFSRMLKYYKDSTEIDSLAKEYEISDYALLTKISGTKSRGGIEYLNLYSGDTIPDFYVTNELDSVVSIRAFKDKVVYINFWATWCGPCIQNIPALNNMIADFEKDDKIVFLNICLDSEKEKWPSTISRYKLKGINLLAEGNWNSKLRSYFNIKGIPHYAILRENNILEENFANKAPLVKEKISEIRHTTGAKKP